MTITETTGRINTFTNFTLNDFGEFGFIAGSYMELKFYCYTSASAPIDLTYMTAVWILSPYDHPSFITLSKPGYCENGYFTVYLDTNDTLNLAGKFIHKAIVIGDEAYTYRLGQGIINIIPAITSGCVTSSTYFTA